MRKFLQKALAAILLLNAILVTPVFAEGNPVITIIPAEVQAALTDNLSASPQLWKNDAGDITLTLMRYAASDASKDPAESGEEFSIEFPVNIETAGQYELSLIASRTDVNTYSHYAISVDGGEALDVKSPNVSEAQPYADSTIANAKYALRKYSMLNLYNLDAGAHTVKITATTRGTSRVDIYLENIALAYKGGLPDYSQITVDGRTGYTDEGNLPVSTETWDNGIMSCGKLRKGDADVATGEWFAAYSFNCEISGMIDKVRAQNPDAEFILVSSIVGNPAAGNVGMTIPQLREGIYELAQEYTGVAVADMTSIHSQLLEKKKYLDMTGNNINHINDYLGRWYAQILSALLIEG